MTDPFPREELDKLFDEYNKPENVLKRQAKRMETQEINEAVARKLGYKLKNQPSGLDPLPNWIHPIGVEVERVPDYCTEISAAWEIVEWIQRQSLDVNVFYDHFQKRFICMIDHMDKYADQADTAPKAICLAFLRLP